MARITHDQKEAALEALLSQGTLQAGAKAAGVDVLVLKAEMRRSAMFKKRVLAAREEGKRSLADAAIDLIKAYAYGEYPKTETDRNRLTAAIALANAFEPGFRGTTTIQGRIEHAVRVITAVPRPKYIEGTVKVLPEDPATREQRKKDRATLRRLNSGKPLMVGDTKESA